LVGDADADRFVIRAVTVQVTMQDFTRRTATTSRDPGRRQTAIDRTSFGTTAKVILAGYTRSLTNGLFT
jgi:hypothetical protein